MKNGGWFHPFDSKREFKPEHVKPSNPTTIDAPRLMKDWESKTEREWVERIAEKLGILSDALVAMNCAWCPTQTAWAFPMRTGDGTIVGIRLRNEAGEKWAVKGSKQGIFIPNYPVTRTACICEGPTDTAAAISIGMFAVGRPSCSSGNEYVRDCFTRRHIHRAIIISDNDSPGLNGSSRLAQELPIPTCTFVPPAKDLRDFVKNGGTAELIEAMTKDLVWTKKC